MMLLQRLRYLQAPADGTGDSGSGDGEAKAPGADSDPSAKDPAGGEGSPDSAKDGGQGERKSVISDSGADQGDASKDGKETPKEGDKDAAEGKAPEPVKVTLPDKLPDGLTVDQEFVTAFEAQAQKFGLDSEKASSLAAWYFEQEGKRVAKSSQDLNQWSDEQYDTLKKDPEFGGKNWDESRAAIQKVNQQFGKKHGFAERLAALQLDNDPAIVKTLAAIGRALSEDRSNAEVASGDAPNTKEAKIMDVTFPSHRKLRQETKG